MPHFGNVLICCQLTKPLLQFVVSSQLCKVYHVKHFALHSYEKRFKNKV